MREDNNDEKLYYLGIHGARCTRATVRKLGSAGCSCCCSVAAAEILRCALLIRRPLAWHESLKNLSPEQVRACKAI